MPNLSVYYQSGICYDFFFNKQLPIVSNIYLGLSSGVPTNVFNGNELSGSNYVRQNIGTGVTTWSFNLNSGLVYNNNQITFPIAAAYWGWVSGCVIYDGSSFTANPVFWIPLGTAKEITQNDQFYVPVSGLGIQVH